MQTLFIKKNKLEKKNNNLVNTFFINMLIITILSFKIIPFLSSEIILLIIMSLFLVEGLIVKKVKNNEEIIQEINYQINYLKENNSKNKDKVFDNNFEITNVKITKMETKIENTSNIGKVKKKIYHIKR